MNATAANLPENGVITNFVLFELLGPRTLGEQKVALVLA
jgi:hypothetical protein